jgi:hypothetical protein
MRHLTMHYLMIGKSSICQHDIGMSAQYPPGFSQHPVVIRKRRRVISMSKFEILTPLNFTVRTSEEYWQKIIAKHPDIADLEAEVRQVLIDPNEIRRSNRDPNLLLFYLIMRERRWVVAVARRLNGDGFLITAYQSDAIKEGEALWHR